MLNWITDMEAGETGPVAPDEPPPSTLPGQFPCHGKATIGQPPLRWRTRMRPRRTSSTIGRAIPRGHLQRTCSHSRSRPTLIVGPTEPGEPGSRLQNTGTGQNVAGETAKKMTNGIAPMDHGVTDHNMPIECNTRPYHKVQLKYVYSIPCLGPQGISIPVINGIPLGILSTISALCIDCLHICSRHFHH